MKKTQQLGIALLIFLFMSRPESTNDTPQTVMTVSDSAHNISTATSGGQTPVVASRTPGQ